MRALQVVCPEPGRVELQPDDLPPLQPNQVLIETEVTLISPGTERAWFLQEPDTPVRFPYHPGYCHVGRIAAVGSEVRQLQPGQRVVSQAPHASAAIAAASQVVPVPEGVTAEQAVFAPLAMISLQGVRRAGIQLGTSAAIVGAGLIGLLALKFVRLAGAHPVVACDLSPLRRQAALRAGACQAVPPDELAVVARQLERQPTPDPGFDVVVDATGHPGAFNLAIEVCGGQGTLLLLGSTRGRADGVPVYEIHRKGLHIVGAHARNTHRQDPSPKRWTSRDEMALVLRLLRDGRLDVSDLITDRIPPQAVPEAFQRLARREEGLLGCVIEWGQRA